MNEHHQAIQPSSRIDFLYNHEWADIPLEYRHGLKAIYHEIQESFDQLFGVEYKVLGIFPGASKREIKNAYRRAARKAHPDKGGSDAEMKRVNAAYKKALAAAKA
jgi:DnaJ-class molecular chaperone